MTDRQTYINHCMSCPNCYAPNARYCPEGLELRLQADAVFIASLDNITDRRRWMACIDKRNPAHMPRLKELVAQKYKERT